MVELRLRTAKESSCASLDGCCFGFGGAEAGPADRSHSGLQCHFLDGKEHLRFAMLTPLGRYGTGEPLMKLGSDFLTRYRIPQCGYM